MPLTTQVAPGALIAAALPQSNSLTMSSREIAELTGKDISHIHRDIRGMLDELVDDPELDHVREDKDSRGYTSCFHLPKSLTMTLVAGYSVKLRKAIIDRWQELESQLSPALPNFMNPAEAARAWADAIEKTQQQAAALQHQQALIESQRPAVEFLDRFVEAKSTKSLREVAKVLGLKEREFIARLEAEDILFRQSGSLLPHSRYQHQAPAYFEVKTGAANGHAYHQTRFTPEGIAWIAKRFCGSVQ